MYLFRVSLDLYLKIFFYLVLIVYHAVDVYYDWAVYKESSTDNWITREDNLITGAVFLGSCIAGTATSILLGVIYGYYIKFHRSFLPNRNDYEPLHMNHRVITMELTISCCELFLKELIQASILFTAFKSSLPTTCVSKTIKAFTVCCLMANIKLLVIFYSKLCGLGVGEEVKSIIKALVCCVGCSGALLGLWFTALYYSEIKNLVSCADM